MWSALFTATNLIALIGWVMLVALPRKPLTHSAILYMCVGLLCMIYLALFGLFMTGSVDPGGLPTKGEAGFNSIEQVRTMFMSDAGIVIGWTHYLAFDLFTGLWIARDADAKEFSRYLQIPFLAATFIAGPIGLFAWLVLREPAARRLGRG
jgi:D-alanyl-lipoteichoic acid acyltransferase DltB (MBOAT superfamily)